MNKKQRSNRKWYRSNDWPELCESFAETEQKKQKQEFYDHSKKVEVTKKYRRHDMERYRHDYFWCSDYRPRPKHWCKNCRKSWRINLMPYMVKEVSFNYNRTGAQRLCPDCKLPMGFLPTNVQPPSPKASKYKWDLFYRKFPKLK